MLYYPVKFNYKFLYILCFIFTSLTGNAADVKFKNTTTKKLFIAIAYLENSWISKGWYSVSPGETRKLLTNYDNRYIYYYAQIEGSNADYSGDYPICVDDHNSFTKYRADASCSSGVMKDFRQIDLEEYNVVYTLKIDKESYCKGDCTNGFGTYFYKNGSYKGKWKNDMRHGPGTYSWNNGESYSGLWSKNKKDGFGVATYSNGGEYIGKFERDKYQDRGGKYYFPNGDEYHGTFSKGDRTGKGKYFFANGNRYEGEFKRGKLHGEGVFYYKDGSNTKGIWENDEWKYHGILNLVLAVNTINVSIGSNAKEIESVLLDFYKDIAKKGRLKLKVKTFNGSTFKKSSMKNFANNFKCGINDVVVFHYFGHGGRTSSTIGKWPLMKLCSTSGDLESCGVSLEYFKDKLYSNSSARLGLFFSDSCNLDGSDPSSECNPERGAYLSSNSLYQKNIEALFIKRKGYLMASSSSVGEYSSTIPGGTSFYTVAFVETLQYYLEKSNSKWSEIMDDIKTEVYESTKDCQKQKTPQTPQHEIALTKIN